MYSIRGNGDNIAQEFYNILGSNQTIKKVAQEVPATTDYSVDESVVTDDALTDLLVDNAAAEVDNNLDSLDDQINDMVDYADDSKVASENSALLSKHTEQRLANDPTGQYIMSGLGKIAASLRGKGEGFAADVVEATAFSINGDLVKEAKRKTGIINVLNKIAFEFDNNRDNFAADMVKATISKISN